MGNAVKATGNALSGTGKFVTGDTKGAKAKFKNSGKHWKHTGQQIANTAGDIGKTVKHTTYSAVNVTVGITNKAAGTVVNSKKLKKKGDKQIKKAGKQALQSVQHITDVVGGKAQVYGDACVNVGIPYNINIVSVNTKEIKARSGAVACLLELGVVLTQLEGALKSFCNGFVIEKIVGLAKKVKMEMKQFRFNNVKNDAVRDMINQYWDNVWQPENISFKFVGDNMCFALNNSIVNGLINFVNGLRVQHNIDVNLNQKMGFSFVIEGDSYNGELIIDFDAVNVFCNINGAGIFCNKAKCILEELIRNGIKKITKHIIRCYRCDVNVVGDGIYIKANANVCVKGNATKY